MEVTANKDKFFIPSIKKIKIQEYPYSILKIVPYKTSYKPSDFEKILNTLHKYNKPFLDRFEYDKENKQLIYRPNQSICHEILFTKDKISYFYVIPEIYKNVFINKAKFLLPNCEICEEEDYLSQFNNSLKQSLTLSKNWMFSLNTSESININDSFLVLHKDIQSDNDKILIQQILQQADDSWKNRWYKYYTKYNNTGYLVNNFDIFAMLDNFGDFVLTQIDLMINAIMSAVLGEEIIQIENKNNSYSSDLSHDTKYKASFDGFKTNFNIYVKSDNPITVNNVTRNTQIITKDLKGDNDLVVKTTKHIKKPTRKLNHSNSFICNTKETIQFIKTPSQDRMKEFEDIFDKVNVEETETPKEVLENCGIILGDILRGNSYKQIGFGMHKDSLSKPLIYLSQQEGGKSSFLRMYGIGALEQGHSIFAFDTIDGKTTKIIRDYLPKSFPEKKIIVLDFKNEDYAFSLLWNEIADIYKEKLQNSTNKYEKYQVLEGFGSIIGKEIERFVDIFQEEDRQNKLTAPMRSALSILSQLVFMNGGNFGMIKDCINDENLRHKLLKNLNIPYHMPFAREILKLDDEKSSTTLRGVETRLDLILGNATLKKYFSLDTDKKLDFAKWANEGYCVLIQIPEHLSNVLVTFLSQKIWLAVTTSRYDIREDDRPMTHLLIDEPNRFPTVMDLLRDHIIASRKWRLRFIFCIHSMDIFARMTNNLLSAGTTLIMLPTDINNFIRVKEFYKNYDYSALQEVERLIAKSDGKLRYALVSLHYKSANYPMIVKLPLPVEMRYKRIDRSYLDEQCAKEYGVSQREYYEKLFNKYDDVTPKISNDKVAI